MGLLGRRKKVDIEALFGPDVAAQLGMHLGPERVSEFAGALVQDARKRWVEKRALVEPLSLLLE